MLDPMEAAVALNTFNAKTHSGPGSPLSSDMNMHSSGSQSNLRRRDSKARHDREINNPYDAARGKVSIRERLHHFTWAWYTFPMSTGGLSLLLNVEPLRFNGLHTIGYVMYIASIIVFSAVTAAMAFRFALNPGTLMHSIKHQREGFFLGTAFLAVATLISGMNRYLIPANDPRYSWLVQTTFWGYAVSTFLLAVFQYSYVFKKHHFGLQTMMPTWILPIFPLMLSGAIASSVAETQPQVSVLPLILAGLACQSLGMLVAFLMYSHMVGRLMETGLPHRDHRPALFMNVGPPAFTALALISLARVLPEDVSLHGKSVFLSSGTVQTIAAVSAVILWTLSLFWCCIAIISVLANPPKQFHLSWWAMVFPNVGFTLSTIALADDFENTALQVITCSMTIGMVLVYFFVLINHIRALMAKEMMYPGKDEDADH